MQVLNRNSESYARATEKVAELKPAVASLGGGVYEVGGSSGNTYIVREVAPGLFDCACRHGRKPAICYHAVAVNIYRRTLLARFHAEVAGCVFEVPDYATQAAAAVAQAKLDEHRACCERCLAGEECRKAQRQMEKAGRLVQVALA